MENRVRGGREGGGERGWRWEDKGGEKQRRRREGGKQRGAAQVLSVA